MKKLIIISFAFLSCLRMNAQEYHLSMYDAAPIYLNPALTGVVDASWRAHAQYRNQWRAFAFKPFTTALVSLDAPKGKWGFGGQILNMRAGLGNFNSLEVLGSAAYTVPLDGGKKSNLTFGIQGGLKQKSVEYSLLSYNNQYTTYNGGGFDNTIASGEAFTGQTIYLPQVNAGVLYYYAGQKSRFNPFVGYSIFNLTQPKESFYGVDNKLPIRHYVHAGLRFNITELIYIIPKVLIMQQTNASEQTAAIDAGFYLKNQKMFLLAGSLLRVKDAGVAYIGLRKDSYIFKVGYDMNVSKLREVSKYRGAIEVSFTYLPIKKKSDVIKICPRI